MSDMFNLRLPASELAKLGPFPTQSPAVRRDEVVTSPSAPDALPVAVTRRRRPVHHLSGFARA